MGRTQDVSGKMRGSRFARLARACRAAWLLALPLGLLVARLESPVFTSAYGAYWWTGLIGELLRTWMLPPLAAIVLLVLGGAFMGRQRGWSRPLSWVGAIGALMLFARGALAPAAPTVEGWWRDLQVPDARPAEGEIQRVPAPRGALRAYVWTLRVDFPRGRIDQSPWAEPTVEIDGVRFVASRASGSGVWVWREGACRRVVRGAWIYHPFQEQPPIWIVELSNHRWIVGVHTEQVLMTGAAHDGTMLWDLDAPDGEESAGTRALDILPVPLASSRAVTWLLLCAPLSMALMGLAAAAARRRATWLAAAVETVPVRDETGSARTVRTHAGESLVLAKPLPASESAPFVLFVPSELITGYRDEGRPVVSSAWPSRLDRTEALREAADWVDALESWNALVVLLSVTPALTCFAIGLVPSL